MRSSCDITLNLSSPSSQEPIHSDRGKRGLKHQQEDPHGTMVILNPYRIMNDIIKHIAGTYKALRLALFLIGFSLPLILMISGKMSNAKIPLGTHSMSAYYHLNALSFEDSNGEYKYRLPKDLGVMRN